MSLTATLVGGPTVVLEIGGLRLITDPTFDPPQTYTGAGTEGTNGITKITGPALDPEAVAPIQVALISHDQHIDNLDEAGRAFLGQVGSVFTTGAGAQRLANGAIGLDDYRSASVPLPGGGQLTITGVPAHHGPDGVWQLVGPVTGFVLTGAGLPTVYVSGDNADLELVEQITERVGPIDVAVLFAGGAGFDEVAGGAPLTLTNAGSVRAARITGAGVVIPVHTDSWAHFRESAEEMRQAFETAGIGDRIVVLEPGRATPITTGVLRGGQA